MKTKNLSGKLVVITGGSSGIGLALAELSLQRGAQVLLVARNEEKLAACAKRLGCQDRVHTVSADVSRSADVRRIRTATRAVAPCADLLVNSAGVVSAGLLHEVPMGEWDRLHRINVRGLVMVLQALIPDMIAQSGADHQQRHIVNVSSAAGFSSVPGMSAYGATKAAVTALSESLRGELADVGIGVTAVCPGFVKTPIAETIQLFGRMNSPRVEKQISRLFALGNLSPEKVAQRTLRGVARNRGMVVIGREAKASQAAKRLFPESYLKAVGRLTRY